MTGLSILYRGPLASCDFDCGYCPLPKRRDPPAALRADRAALARFVDWVEQRPPQPRVGVLFTPWGEALIRGWYRQALVRLSHLPQVERAVAQTNLSVLPHWVADADPAVLALWCTYHPGQVTLARFLAGCALLQRAGVRFSVGVVGLPEHWDAARQLRAALPAAVYLWVNAADGRRYPAAEVAAWTRLDPLFGFSVRPHPSVGVACRTGSTVVSVSGDGTVRRCHFVSPPLGNIYEGWLAGSTPSPEACPNATCDCHIGYVHLRSLPLYDVFAGGVLERIPAQVFRAVSVTPSDLDLH